MKSSRIVDRRFLRLSREFRAWNASRRIRGRRKDRKGRRDRAWLRSDLTSKVRVSIRPDCEETRFALLPQQRQQQQRSNNVGAAMCVLEQQLYSRLVFYGRFMNAALPFRTGDPRVSSRAKIGGRRMRQRGREGETKKREENGCSVTRIFIRKGLSVIYWKSLPRSCGFVASPREASCEPHLSP